jgi:hypothetical protein
MLNRWTAELYTMILKHPRCIQCTRWFKYDRDYLFVNKSQFVPVIFEPPCTLLFADAGSLNLASAQVTALDSSARKRGT